MKIYLFKLYAICLTLLALGGCSFFEKEHPAEETSAPEQSTSSQQVEATNFPPQLLKWVANSGWDIPEEMLAAHTMPVADDIEAIYPEIFMLETENHRYELQNGNSCGGYAAAYLLRALGNDISGQEAYDSMGYKITHGLVLPQGILDYLANSGNPAVLYQGGLEQLKTRLSTQGSPIIVLVGSGTQYQHYITLLGYDENNMYFFDSAKPESSGTIYNSVISNEDFMPLWQNIIPGFERIYITNL